MSVILPAFLKNVRVDIKGKGSPVRERILKRSDTKPCSSSGLSGRDSPHAALR